MQDSWPRARRVGVVADTHFPHTGRAYPEALLQGLRGVDLILHAGDLVILSALEPLEQIAPVVAVFGNMDSLEVRAVIPARRILQIGRFRVGLVHGHPGAPDVTPEHAIRAFTGTPLDAIVFGHSHVPLCETRDGVLLFNPGSPTDRRFAPYRSYGILHAGDELRGEIVRMDGLRFAS